jgi:hypothetical protein
MTVELSASLAVALLFGLIHVGGSRFDRMAGTPRSAWLSAAGGISVAYVFVDILPELAAHQRVMETALDGGGLVGAIERHVYVVALLGLAIFYGLDTLLRRSSRSGGHGTGIFWTHLGIFALYNLLIGYLLVHREHANMLSMAMFAVALGLHFLVNDQSIRSHHGRLYHDRGRWLLGAAPLAGWLLGIGVELDPLALSATFALLAGSIVLNVLKEELPEDRDSRFWAFALAAGAYSGLLLLIE